MNELQPNTSFSHYRIVVKLGAGGMGEVFLAQDTSELGRTVALKILPAEVAKDKDRLQRFTQEARTVSNLNHPNILTVYEFGQTESASFIATEYVDGVTLRQHLSKRHLKLVDVLDLSIQIVAALNAAHEAGVTHRDLKPENMMVRPDHIVKVLDFGLAKPTVTPLAQQVDSEAGTRVFVQTEPGLVMGTVSYMSPEQSAGASVDQRTDIWSFGVVLYEMIAGCVPFQGKDIHRQIIAIQESEPPLLSQQVEGVPERLEEVVTKCLAKDRDERYQVAKDLLIDLRNLRRKLDVDAEIERTVAPEFRSTSGGARAGVTTADSGVSAGTNATETQATSSAEYIVAQVTRHKAAALIVVAVLVAASVTIAYYVYARHPEVAVDSVAVLPFDNRNSDSDTDYLAEGLTESLIYRLSQLPNLKVSPRSSVVRYQGKQIDPIQVARELGVSAVLSGRISKRGDNLTISAELVDVRYKTLLWGEQYDRNASDMLATQREIASEIAEKLKVKVSGAEQKGLTKHYTQSNEAYQLYLKGRYHWNKRTKVDLERSIDYFQQAIARDPNFALAFVGIADSYTVMPSYPYLSAKEAMPRAQAAARRALELDPTQAEAHAALAQSLASYEWKWTEAEREFKRAIELDPKYANAHYFYSLNYLTAQGRTDEAITEMKRALELEPLSLVMNANLAAIYVYARQYDNAVEQARKTYDLEPNFTPSIAWLAEAYAVKGMYSEGVALCEKALQSAPTGQPFLSALGYVQARAGKRREAELTLNKLKDISRTQYISFYRTAKIPAALGHREEALALLEKAFEERDYSLPRLKVDPAFDPIRDDPRFRDLVRRVGLPQ